MALHIAATRTILKTFAPADGDVAILLEGASASGFGRSGQFVFTTSDLSTEVGADDEEGIYIPPDSAPSGSSGAWVRLRESPHIFNVAWFGAIPNSADNTPNGFAAALQAAVDLAQLNPPASFVEDRDTKKIIIPAGRYLPEAVVTVGSNGIELWGEGVGATIIDAVNSTTGFIRFRDPNYMFNTQLERVGLRDMYIMTSSTADFDEPDVGAQFFLCKHWTLENVRFANFSRNLELYASSSPTFIDNVEFWQNRQELTGNRADHVRILTLELDPTARDGDIDATLKYKMQTASFVEGDYIEGQTSGAIAKIARYQDFGTTGVLTLNDFQPTGTQIFVDGEDIVGVDINGTPTGNGAAKADGTVDKRTHGNMLYFKAPHFRSRGPFGANQSGPTRSNIFIESIDGLKVTDAHFGNAKHQVLIAVPTCANPVGNCHFSGCLFDGVAGNDAGNTDNNVWIKPKAYVGGNLSLQLNLINCKLDSTRAQAVLLENIDWTDLLISGGETREIGGQFGPHYFFDIRGGAIRNCEIRDVRIRTDKGSPPIAAIRLNTQNASFFKNVIIKGNTFFHGGSSNGDLPSEWIHIEGNGTNAVKVEIAGNAYEQSITKPNGTTSEAANGLIKNDATGTVKLFQHGNECLTRAKSPQTINNGTSANVTLTVDSNAPDILDTSSLMQNRNRTLSQTRAKVGDQFRITRKGPGFILVVINGGPAADTLAQLAPDRWGEFVFNGTDWYLARSGTLLSP